MACLRRRRRLHRRQQRLQCPPFSSDLYVPMHLHCVLSTKLRRAPLNSRRVFLNSHQHQQSKVDHGRERLRRQRRKRWSRQCQRQSLRANDEDISGDGDDDDDNERKRILSSRRVGQTRVCQRQRVLNAIFQINGTGRDTKTENGKGCASNVSCVVVQRVSFLLQVLYVSLYLSLGVFRVSLFLSFSKCCACERQSRALLLLFFLLVPGFLFLVRHLWRDPPLLRTQNNTFRLVVYLESLSQLHFFESLLREKLVGRSWIFSF